MLWTIYHLPVFFKPEIEVFGAMTFARSFRSCQIAARVHLGRTRECSRPHGRPAFSKAISRASAQHNVAERCASSLFPELEFRIPTGIDGVHSGRSGLCRREEYASGKQSHRLKPIRSQVSAVRELVHPTHYVRRGNRCRNSAPVRRFRENSRAGTATLSAIPFYSRSVESQRNPTYNALQTKVEKRFSKGVTFRVAHEFSKTISDSDILAGGGPSRQTSYNRKLEKALSTNDVPQIFAANVLYELLFGPGKSMLSDGVSSRVLGGWMITGVAQYQVGRPIPLAANNTLPLFNSTRRPNVIADAPLQNSFDHFDPAVDPWINAAAFQVPARFTFGTTARDYSNLRAPAFKNQSVGLSKRTLLAENVSLTFRAELFNVFNRVVFAAPASNISAANFGNISTQATAPRQGQVSLRLEF
jgi:hypothetical protein